MKTMKMIRVNSTTIVSAEHVEAIIEDGLGVTIQMASGAVHTASSADDIRVIDWPSG